MRCLRVRAHLGDGAKIAELFSQIQEEFGRLDILINNAASGVQQARRRPPGEALGLDDEHQRQGAVALRSRGV